MAHLARAIVVIYVAITAISVLLTYTLSVVLGHVNAFLPYLSYLGDKPLESTIFTQCFVIDAAALMFVIQIKFVHAFHHLGNKERPVKDIELNLAGGFMGYIAAVGLFVIACFQESNAYYVHQIAGVFLYFLSSVIYFTIQSILSKKIANNQTDVTIFKIRILLNVFMIFFFIVFEVGYLIALKKFQKPWNRRCEWTKEDGGWLYHVLSAGSEWVLLILFQSYFLTFIYDFRNVVLTKTQIIITFDG